MKTIDFTAEDFHASMQGTVRPSEPIRSTWEQMCDAVMKAQYLYPQGHWPAEFERIAKHENLLERIETDSDTTNMSFVELSQTHTVLLTDKETGEQKFVDITTPCDPYEIESDSTTRWIDNAEYERIKISLANAGCMRYINDVIEHMTKKCSTQVMERVYREHLLIAAMQRIAGKNRSLVA